MENEKESGLKIILCLEDESFAAKLKSAGIFDTSDSVINTQSQSLKVSGEAGMADVIIVDETFEQNNHYLLGVILSKFKSCPVSYFTGRRSPEGADPGKAGYDFIYTADDDGMKQFRERIAAIRQRKNNNNNLPPLPPQIVFNAILKNMAEGFMYVDNDDAILYVNDQFCNMVGYTYEELIGQKGYTLLIAEEDRDMLLQKNEARTKNVSDHYEIRMIKKSGAVIWVAVIGTPVTNQEGAVIGSVGIISDITATKRSEAFLRRSSGLLNTLLTHVTVALLEVDKEGRVVYSAGRVFENIGLTDADIVGKKFDDLFGSLDIYFLTGKTIKVSEVTQRLLAGEFVYGFSDFKGYYFENYFTPLYSNAGTPAGGVIFAFDVTERKTIQKKMRETEDKYQTLVENINDIIISINRDYNIDFISPVVTRMLGYEPGEMTGMPVQEYIFAPDSLPFRDGVMAVFTGITRPIEFRAITKMGTMKWLRASLRPHYENGRIISAQGVFSDVHEKKDMEQKLILAKERAEEVSRLKSYFLANMSHELRTPMIGILGYAEILQEELTDDETQKMAATIFASGNRLLETLNLILDLSKIESGKLEIIKTDFDVRDEIRGCIATFAKTADKRGLTLELQGDANPKLHLDKRLFRDTINNLLSNAIKFTHIGGVTVEYYIEKRESKENVVIMVTDTGIGIPERSQTLIFEEFRQVSQGYGREYEGTGLGLSVSKKFVESMGGTIKVKSIQGKGSTFTVTFPVKK